jgi:hypothetical protein
MKTKTEKKIILYFTLFYANFLIYNFAFAEFKDWKEEVKSGLAVIEQKHGLEEFYIPNWMYEPNMEEKADNEQNKEQEGISLGEANKEVADSVSAEADDQPRWVEEIDSPQPSEESIQREIERVFGNKAEEAKLICGCESRYQVDIWGDTNTPYKSVGLFQIRELPKRMEFYGLTTEMLEDYKTNIYMAKIIYDKAGGWSPWLNCGNKYNLIKNK